MTQDLYILGHGQGITNKAVIHFIGGSTAKGTLYDFHPEDKHFHLLTREANVDERKDIQIETDILKAIFFVRSYSGNSHHSKVVRPKLESLHEQRVMVEFVDGEILVGETPNINPDNKGFFLFPVDGDSNNACIFVVYRAVKEIKIGKAAEQ